MMTQPVASPREVCEAGDEAEAVLVDELAARFRREGASAGAAMSYAKSMRGWLRERDRAACGGGGVESAGGAGAGGCVSSVGGVASAAVAAVREEFPQLAGETLRMMVIKIVQAPRPRFSAGCLLLAMGMEHNGITSSNAWADRQHLSHELAADCVEDWQRAMGLPRNKWQKSAEAIGSYRDSNGKQKQAA